MLLPTIIIFHSIQLFMGQLVFGPKEVSGAWQLCSSESPWDLAPLDFLSLQTLSPSLPVVEEVWFQSHLGAVHWLGAA